MFKVNGTHIRISRGDTGLLTFVTDTPLDENARAVFTVRRRNGSAVMEKVAVPDGNRVQIPLMNEETQALHEGDYEWDIRYALDAVIDENGRVTDGREVITPMLPGVLIIERVVGTI